MQFIPEPIADCQIGPSAGSELLAVWSALLQVLPATMRLEHCNRAVLVCMKTARHEFVQSP